MKFYRVWALIERDLRKFFRSPALMMVSMIFPLVQLLVLGYAFGGKIKNAPVAFVDLDHSVESRKVREMFQAVAAGPQTFKIVDYNNLPDAIQDLRSGFVRGVIQVPHDFSERYFQKNRPRISFSEDNTDQFISTALESEIQGMVNQLNSPSVHAPLNQQVGLDVVEVYPYIEYAKFLLAGAVTLGIFSVAMIGGGITFIDDKSRGLHEGYLVTPIHKSELVFGLIGAGAIKGLMAGMCLAVIGGLMVGIPRLWDPVRLAYIACVIFAASLAMMSFMFLLMVRVSDPLVPRAIFGVLNTLLYFPSGAVYPIEAFPSWLRWIANVDPLTPIVHALQNLTLKNTGIEGIYSDVLVLLGFTVLMTAGCVALFQRQL
ncbi:MAG TPA: ABC transporter permease [Candidatus Acidoferrales bacterium]|nr:ABC transporter permease [Candidatus Acidoferrales bacterium]